ncbi:MAG: glycosyltransferase, partial [Bacteroidota bacterium]
MHEMKRVLLISNVPQPYRVPLFNEIGKQFKELGVEFKVVFAAAGYKRRKAKIDFSEMKFQYEILKSLKISFGNVEKTMFTYGGINSVISKFRPDKIIVLGFSLATVKIYIRSFFQKINYVIWSGAIEFPGRFDSAFRKFERRLLIKRASAFVAYGSKAKEYLVKMGAPAEKVFIGINTVDTEFFASESGKIRAIISRQEKKHLLYVGYLVPRKNVSKLITIIEELSKRRNDFILDILGDGSEKILLEKLVEEKKLGSEVTFHGFIQRNELPRYFAQ